MKHYLFMSMEGFTYDPNHTMINNTQLLGSAKGTDVLEAFKHFKRHQSYLSGFAFKHVIAIEYVGDFIHNLEL